MNPEETTTGPPPPLATVLPHDLASRLQRASQHPGSSFDRLKAVEEATRQIKLFHPQYFRKDES